MSIIRKEIQFSGLDVNLNIELSSDNRLSGLQQEIDNFSQIKSANSINGITDGEVTRFAAKYEGNTPQAIKFDFSATTTPTWVDSFIVAGFTVKEIESLAPNFQNSFFIWDLYDSMSSTEQTKLFTTQLTNLYEGNFLYFFNSFYFITNTSQFYYLNVPNNVITLNDGQVIYTAYSKFSFYDAKSGKVRLFYNKDNGNEETSTVDKMYFETRLYLDSKTWEIIAPAEIYARELTISPTYTDKVNDGVERYNNGRAIYPTGNTFQYSGGTYTDT